MGLARYHLLMKIKKTLEQKTSASQSLTGHMERIMKQPVEHPKKPAPAKAAKEAKKPKTVRPPN